MLKLTDYFQFKDLALARIQNDEIDETVGLINPAYSYQDDLKGAAGTSPERLRGAMAETDFFVVKAGGKIVGCVYLEPKHDSLHFGLLTVAEEYRKTGLAPAMMAAIEAFAKESHYNVLDLIICRQRLG